jgi:prolipoprotein diacylglyceryltransferase
MFWYYGKKHGKVLHGHLFGIFLILMFTFRFILEYTKINEGISDEAILNMGQILSIPFVLAGVAIAYIRHKAVVQNELKK